MKMHHVKNSLKSRKHSIMAFKSEHFRDFNRFLFTLSFSMMHNKLKLTKTRTIMFSLKIIYDGKTGVKLIDKEKFLPLNIALF